MNIAGDGLRRWSGSPSPSNTNTDDTEPKLQLSPDPAQAPNFITDLQADLIR